MAWRRRLSEFEADLYKVKRSWFFAREMGELERKSYADGEETLKIVFHGIDAPDGSKVSVVIDGAELLEMPVERRRGRLFLSSNQGAELPEVKSGQKVEIRLLGTPVLEGTFKRD